MPLERERAVHAVAGPEGAGRRGVRVDGAAHEPHGAQAVVAGERVRGHRREEGLLAAVGAAVHEHDRLAADDLAVGGHRRPDADLGVLARERRAHLLLAREAHLHRQARPLREQGGERLDARLVLLPEAAADGGRDDDADRAVGAPEQARDRAAHRPRVLRGGLDDVAAVLEARDGDARLERRLVLAPDGELALDDRHVVAGECLVGVAAHDRRLPCDVARTQAAGDDLLVALPVGMEVAGAGRERLGHREVGLERLGLDDDRRRRRAGELERLRRDRGDGLAVEAHVLAREERVVGDADAVQAGRVAPP